MKRAILGIVILAAVTLFAQTYLDSTASMEARVQDLLARMTLDEKVGQTIRPLSGRNPVH